MESKNKSVTVKDVASLAKVAPSTVSLVLNNSPRVREGTRNKVLKVIKELNYIPNNFAVSLRQNVSVCVGVIVPSLSNAFYVDIINGLKRRCNESNIPIYISETNHSLKEEENQIQILRGVKANRFVFIGTKGDEHLVETLIENNKIVYIDKCDETGKIPYVMIDNYKSSYDACKYLIGKGCKNIYYITQSVMTKPLINRRDGFIDALRDYNMGYKHKVIHANEICTNKMESGYMAMKYILEKHKLDGIIAASDQIAVGALRLLHEYGVSVPQDISVIGFDNIEISKYTIPTLTTISQPMKLMGELAFSLVTSDVDEEERYYGKEDKCFIMKHDFIIRESTL